MGRDGACIDGDVKAEEESEDEEERGEEEEEEEEEEVDERQEEGDAVGSANDDVAMGACDGLGLRPTKCSAPYAASSGRYFSPNFSSVISGPLDHRSTPFERRACSQKRPWNLPRKANVRVESGFALR